MPRLNVLLVNTSTEPVLGADTWVHAEIFAAIDRSSHSLHAACVRRSSDGPTPTFELLDAIDDVKILEVHPGPDRPSTLTPRAIAETLASTLSLCWSVARIATHIRRHDIHVVHSSDRPRDALICVLLSKITRARSIVHVHVKYDTWMSRTRRWSIARADARIAVSQFVKLSLTRAGMPPDTTHVVLNAVDLVKWTPGLAGPATREEFSIDPAALVIITVCRLFREKGPAELVRAVASLRTTYPEVRLIVVGHDPGPAEAFLHELEDLVSEFDLRDHVIFTGRRTDVPALMAAADVFAMPSFEEPFGLVFGEAMAMELPVIGLDNGGTREIVQHGCQGLLSEPGDLQALTANLSTLLGDDGLRHRLGAAGRRRIESAFTTERMAADAARVYRLVAS